MITSRSPPRIPRNPGLSVRPPVRRVPDRKRNSRVRAEQARSRTDQLQVAHGIRGVRTRGGGPGTVEIAGLLLSATGEYQALAWERCELVAQFAHDRRFG